MLTGWEQDRTSEALTDCKLSIELLAPAQSAYLYGNQPSITISRALCCFPQLMMGYNVQAIAGS